MRFTTHTKINIKKHIFIPPLIETIIIGVAGAFFFTILNFPLAWLLGPLTIVLCWNVITKRNLYWPKSFRNGGQVILGYSMGLSFTAESAKQIVSYLPSMAISTILMVGFALLIAFFVSKTLGLDLPSAVLGTTPGGLSQMVILSEEIQGVDATVVTLLQTVRMLAVIFIVPAISIHGLTAGEVSRQSQPLDLTTQGAASFFAYPLVLIAVLFVTGLAVRFRFPTPWILGPLITTAVLMVTGFDIPDLPPVLLTIGQLCLGVYLGLGIKIDRLGNWKKLLLISLMVGLLTVGFALLLAYALHYFLSIDLATAFLGIAPGGIAEMGVTAHAIDADVSMVAAYQLFRVLFILFIVPVFLRFLFRKNNSTVN